MPKQIEKPGELIMPKVTDDAFSCNTPKSNTAKQADGITKPAALYLAPLFGRIHQGHIAIHQSSAARILFVCIIFSILQFSGAVGVFGQSGSATLNGSVADQNGAVVPDVSITVINISQGFKRNTTTNIEGIFVVPLLPPGSYVLKAQRTGFSTTEIRDVVLNVNDQVVLRIELKVGGITGDTVTVVEGASLIDQSPSVGTIVDRQFVGNLPLNGRSFQSLITLTPGVVLTKADANNRGQFSVNGQRADANYFTVDGVSANVSVTSSGGFSQAESGALPSLTALGGTNNLVSVDALQEFKVLTSSYAAEFGRTPGGQVSIVTRAGTREFHGTLFEYLRNDVLDANDWFANANRLPKPAERQNDFGGVFSGPVLLPRFGEGGRQPWYDGRNRTFFFFSFEGLRLRQPQTALTTVPSLNSRIIAPANIQPYLNAFPRPNGSNLADNLSQFNASFSNPSTLNATSLRVDHFINSNFTVFGRYNYAPSEAVQRGGSRSLSTVSFVRSNTETITVGATAILSALTNELRFNYSRYKAASFNKLDNFGGATVPTETEIFPPFANSDDSLFAFFIIGGTNSSFNLGRNADNRQRQLNLVDTLFLTNGPHQLKFGIDYRRLAPVFNPLVYTQQAIFSGVAGVLSGRASSVFLQQTLGKRFPVFTNLSMFAQDSWRVTPRLNFHFGLRWEMNPPPSEQNGNDPFALTGIENPATLALAAPGVKLFQTTYGNFAPRFGVAFDLSQKQSWQTILRGGFGIFYDLPSGFIANAFANAFPNRVLRNISNVSFPVDPVTATLPPFSLSPPFDTIIGVDPHLTLPRTYQWNVAVEQSLGSSQTLSVSYVGARGRRLLRNELLVNPNPNFTFVNLTKNSATSDYNALQIQFQRRLWRGLQALASYTWAHSIDNASSDTLAVTPTNNVDPTRDRGPSDFDIRHAVNVAVTYNLPSPGKPRLLSALFRQWSVDSIFAARSAPPINLITGRNVFGVFGVSRPDVVPGVPLYINDEKIAGGRRINRMAFAFPPVGADGFTPTRQGTLGRNALRGFPMWQIDFAIRRQIKLTETLNLQLRAEAFNLLNHPNFADPVNNISNSQFGLTNSMLGRSLGTGGTGGGLNQLYQVGGPRSLQLALRVVF